MAHFRVADFGDDEVFHDIAGALESMLLHQDQRERGLISGDRVVFEAAELDEVTKVYVVHHRPGVVIELADLVLVPGNVNVP